MSPLDQFLRSVQDRFAANRATSWTDIGLPVLAVVVLWWVTSMWWGPNESVSGVEVYSLPAQFMLSSGSELKDELTNQAFPNNRFDYANLLLGSELHRSLLTSLKSPDRGYKRARWGVLRPVECPAALVECAYLSNPTEARRAATPEFRQKIAEGIATGLQNYSAEIAALRTSP